MREASVAAAVVKRSISEGSLAIRWGKYRPNEQAAVSID